MRVSHQPVNPPQGSEMNEGNHMEPQIGKWSDEAVDRFWSKVDKTEGCWNWTGARSGFSKANKPGYGSFKMQRRTYNAHRIAWVLTYGDIPAGMQVLHECDNPGCVRPDHLFLGTHRQNMEDASVKGRCTTARGERHKNAKLTADAVREIRRRFASGNETNKGLAREYGITPQAMHSVVNRQTWAWLED